MIQKTTLILSVTLLTGLQSAIGNQQSTLDKPNIIVYFADDISAREIPIYGSSVWIDPMRENTSDPQYRAQMPVLDQLAKDGCWIKTAWAACVCNPSRAMMMSGRYAYQTKWWNNGDKGQYKDPEGRQTVWPVYESSPLLMGHVAQKSGYGTYWSGKTQMAGDYASHGFDEGCFTPGMLADTDNPYTDFKHVYVKEDGKKVLINVDTGKPADTYHQHGWNWYPHIKLMNHPTSPNETVWWPNTPEAQASYGVNTFGPDVELNFAIDFMERTHDAGNPFLIYHTTHLGHGAYDWLVPENGQCWPGTPVLKWDGATYTRKKTNITGDNGEYNTQGMITEQGMHYHLNYIDYQLWQYQQKLEEMEIADNTIIIFAADNGTAKYGKNMGESQKGCHVPMVIYAPGMSKHGEQDVLVSIADIMPTLAEMIGFEFPTDYKLDGESLVPFLFTDAKKHREWLYTYRGPEQLARGKKVLKDGRDNWFDVSGDPEDLISFGEINNWGDVSEAHREERERLLDILPKYDFYYSEYNAPGIRGQSKAAPKKYGRKPPKASPSSPSAKSSKTPVPKVDGKTVEAFCAMKKVDMKKKGKTYDQAKMERLFGKMDANQDGVVTKEEQKAYYLKK